MGQQFHCYVSLLECFCTNELSILRKKVGSSVGPRNVLEGMAGMAYKIKFLMVLVVNISGRVTTQSINYTP